jgi:protein-L-isoaspartate(D-aspartate) O-methyltransferase
VASGEPEAERRNEQLIRQLESTGTLRDAAVAAAFRAVLRHRFLPDRPLHEVYEDAAIMTKIGEHGAPVSSSSQPAIMAIMLQLLELRPGHRVLEIGAGTGYNAALLAHLVGPAGRVVSVDIDPDVAEQARAHLAAAAGPGQVDVVCADGAGGWPAAAPYDRVMVTAGADDLSPAWADQLVEEGRLVLPLALGGPGQQCAALVRHGRSLASERLCLCGFMPLRGGMAPAPAAGDEVAAWLATEGRPTGHLIPPPDVRAGFEAWLGLVADGYVRTQLPSGEAAFGLHDANGVALLPGDGESQTVLVFGDGDGAAARLALAHRAWTVGRPALDRMRIAAHPAGEEPPGGPSVRVVRRPRYTFVVTAA